MDDSKWHKLLQSIEGIPQNPVAANHPSHAILRARKGLDIVTHVNSNMSKVLATVRPYPKPFRHTWITAEDGVRIAAWTGPSRFTQPSNWGVVVVPGMFGTKDDWMQRYRTVRMWKRWRIPVVSIDLRSFGESRGVSTAGWKEALDILAAAKHLRDEYDVTKVSVMAESLGGASALNAAALDGERGTNLISGGVLTWSAFLDAKDAVDYISTRPAQGHPFEPQWAGFRRLLHMKSMGGYQSFSEYVADVSKVHGLSSVDELYQLASAKNNIKHITTPTLLIHSADDPIIPVRHARRTERYAADMENIQSLIVNWGGHTSFGFMDPNWYWEVIRLWFSGVNDLTLPPMTGTPMLK